MFLFPYYNFKNMTYFLQDSLAEVEEKYKKAMVSNAQLDNEKTNFMYQVDMLKDMMLELEEELAESKRQCEEKSKVRAGARKKGGVYTYVNAVCEDGRIWRYINGICKDGRLYM